MNLLKHEKELEKNLYKTSLVLITWLKGVKTWKCYLIFNIKLKMDTSLGMTMTITDMSQYVCNLNSSWLRKALVNWSRTHRWCRQWLMPQVLSCSSNRLRHTMVRIIWATSKTLPLRDFSHCQLKTNGSFYRFFSYWILYSVNPP